MKALLTLGFATCVASMASVAWAGPADNGVKSPVKTSASPTRDSAVVAKDDCARARAAGRTCELTIEGEDIEAGVPTADGARFTAVKWITHGSLLRIRRDFLPEIIKSAEDL